MVDFTSLLEKKLDDVEAPALLPQGSYIMTLAGYRTGESAKKKTPYVEFDLKISSAMDDVDQEELAKVKNLQDKTLKTQFYLNEDALFRLKDFCKKTGVPTEGKSFTEILSEIAGAQLIGIVNHRVNPENTDQVFAEVRSFLPLV
nr:MAG TPA: Protein of unknown function (DUF669) [Caudoviricetes sp.]